MSDNRISTTPPDARSPMELADEFEGHVATSIALNHNESFRQAIRQEFLFTKFCVENSAIFVACLRTAGQPSTARADALREAADLLRRQAKLYRSVGDKILSDAAFAILALADKAPSGETTPIIRCDICDNGVEPKWEYCAWCGARLPCKTCGGSGFSTQGSGYGAVCSDCGGQSAYSPEAAPSVIDEAVLAERDDYIVIDYTNYRGERRLRLVRPQQIEWGANEWHKEPQWLLYAEDVDKDEIRTFAMNSIHLWAQAPRRGTVIRSRTTAAKREGEK